MTTRQGERRGGEPSTTTRQSQAALPFFFNVAPLLFFSFSFMYLGTSSRRDYSLLGNKSIYFIIIPVILCTIGRSAEIRQ